MFGLFKNRKHIEKADYDFLLSIIEKLPKSYSYLAEQINEDFIIDKIQNELGGKGTFRLRLNADLECKFKNNNLPNFFILKDIGIFNVTTQKYELIELHILQGMIAGFKVEVAYDLLDNSKIDISFMKINNFNNDDKLKVLEILGDVPKNIKAILDLDSSFRIEIDDNIFYTIQDIGNGNYLSIDEKGEFYKMIHDPYEISSITDDKRVFYKALLGHVNFMSSNEIR